MRRFAALASLLLAGCGQATLTVGSKQDAESAVLAEMALQLAENAGATVRSQHGLGGTPVLWKALLRGSVDVYPEYTGTITQQILAGRELPDEAALRAALAELGVGMTRPLGFANNYALGMREDKAEGLGVRAVSDLARHPELSFGFSSEFMLRQDGWPGLQSRYRLPQHDVRGLDHQLAYAGLASGDVAVTDLYTTDAEIRTLKLRVLADDRHYFPAYRAVLLYHLDLEASAPEVVAALRNLEGRLDESTMIDLNTRTKSGEAPELVAADYLAKSLGVGASRRGERRWERFWRHLAEHLTMVVISLAAAVAVAVPLGVLAARRPALGQVLLGVTGVIQTIPSLALLVFMIPLPFVGGTGTTPAVVALFLYSLLPILRNTVTGLRDVPPHLRESAEGLGLPPSAVLWRVELPMASRAILAGIKTAAVINVGTATLGALIGAGGFGQEIQQGIQLNDYGRILEGAVPAAVLALVVQGVFELAERRLVPKGLRLAEAR
jgi:osmoprotectant transport system permease protein